MKSPDLDLEYRRPVWQVLSDMYLDTDVALSRRHRVTVLATSPYSLAEIEWILEREIHPVCCLNMTQVAGEWDRFDLIWLEQRILLRKRSVWRWLTGYWLFNPGRSEWIETKREVEKLRSSNH